MRAVIFDLDGTLVDSWRHHTRCLRLAMHEMGLPEPSPAALHTRQGATLRDTLTNFTGSQRAGEALDRYARHASCPRPGEVTAAPGAARVLDALARRGIPAGVCTGRDRSQAETLLRVSGLAIRALVTADDVSSAKPHPQGLRLAARLLRVPVGEVCFVGDGHVDAQQGTAAGVRTFIVGPAAATAAARWPVTPLTGLVALAAELELEAGGE